MVKVQIRRQGGAAIVTIPADLMKMMNVEIGETLQLKIANGDLIATPIHKRGRKRYSLEELMRGVTPKAMREIERDTAWFREGEPVGREIA
jgi:antitoxin ChpS